jgi:serine/threonine protein phosphatase 1
MYFAVSDVHGYYDALKKALRKAGFDIKNKEHKLIICGDLMDRGLESIELLNFVLKLLKQDRIIYIRGNHEDLFLDCYEEMKNFDGQFVNPIHYHNGTVSTYNQLLGRHDEYINLINNVAKDYFEVGDYIFVHGWIPVIVNDDLPVHYARERRFSYNKDWRNASEEDWDAARWINGIEAAKKGIIEPGKTIVCGHWHTGFGHYKYHSQGKNEFDVCDIYYDDGIIALDACTALSQKVNVLVVE